MQEKILKRLHSLGIDELCRVTELCTLNGDYINLEALLPNGKTAKILDGNKKYFAAQVEKASGERRYGIAADEDQIAVYEYGCEGTDAVLKAWIRL